MLYIGIDWSEEHHDVCIMHENGSQLLSFRVAHTPDGLQKLADKINQFGIPKKAYLIGLETAHNLLIDFLWSQGHPLYVLAPNRVNSNRGRHRASRARNDASDAKVIADMLHTDRPLVATREQPGALLYQLQVQLRLKPSSLIVISYGPPYCGLTRWPSTC